MLDIKSTCTYSTHHILTGVGVGRVVHANEYTKPAQVWWANLSKVKAVCYNQLHLEISLTQSNNPKF